MKEEKGIKTSTLDDKPELFQDLLWLWRGFNWLSTRRAYGFSGPLPITASDMHAYCQMASIYREDDVHQFLDIIPKLDDVWLAESYKTQEEKKEAAKKAAERKRKFGGR